MENNVCGNFIVFIFSQQLNAPHSIEVTPSGIVIVSNERQLSNVALSIVLIFGERVEQDAVQYKRGARSHTSISLSADNWSWGLEL